MSKKSRRRNKKILGALAAGLGAMALMRGRKANQTSGMETVSDAQKVASQLGTGNTGTSKVVETAPVKVETTSVPFQNRMTGHGPQVNENISRAQRSQNLANQAKINARNTAIGSPLIDNPYKAPVQQKGRFTKWSRPYKSGGRVKGVGKAKRGFGRALKGGK